MQDKTKDLVMASIYFHPDYLYVKLQVVHPTMEMMEEMQVTQEEMKTKLRWAQTMISEHGNPDSSGDGGGKDPRSRKHASMSINKWAKPIPKLELPPRVHL